MIKGKQSGALTMNAMLGIALGFVLVSTAWADDDSRKALIARVNPSVVKVVTEGGLGSGYVVDASGIIATNCHVVKHAKKVHIVFPADVDKKQYPSPGWLEVMPTRDICLLKIDTLGRKMTPLKIAPKVPVQGDTVYTFGAPLGMDNTISEGMVTSVRTGQQVADLMASLGPKDSYKQMGYEIDSIWIQMSAPISPGNSGGPLINIRGEVLGLNTWCLPSGQNMNFTISSQHIKKLIPQASKLVKTWDKLPDWKGAGHDPGQGPAGEAGVTLKSWTALNTAKLELNAKLDACADRMRRIPVTNPNVRLGLQLGPNKKRASVYKDFSKAYREYAEQIRDANHPMADPLLLKMIIGDASAADQIASIYQSFSTVVLEAGGAQAIEAGEYKLKATLSERRSQYDILIITLSRMYGIKFPTLEDTANAAKKAAEAKKKKATVKDVESSDSSDDTEIPKGFRVWKSRDGEHEIIAKLIRVANERVTLEKKNGKRIVVDIDKLSDEDQEFIENKESEPSPNAKSDDES